MKKNLLTMDILLSKEIKCMIQKQRYQPGDKLPSERQLAECFGVQRLTIRSALNLLLQDQTIVAKPRSGYYVAPGRLLQSTRDFSMNYCSPKTGEPLECRLLAFRKMKADLALSGKMLLPEDTVIYKISRLYCDEGTPICINHSYLPEYVYPGLTRTVAFSASPAALAASQTHIAKANQKITLIYANEEESQLLSLTPGSPLMKHKGLIYDSTGQLAVFFESFMLLDHFAFIREAVL